MALADVLGKAGGIPSKQDVVYPVWERLFGDSGASGLGDPEYQGEIYQKERDGTHKKPITENNFDLYKNIKSIGVSSEFEQLFEGQPRDRLTNSDDNKIRKGFGSGLKTNLFACKITFDKANTLRKYLAPRMSPTNSSFHSGNMDDDQSQIEWTGICTKVRLPGNDITDLNLYGNFRNPVTKSKQALTLDFLDDQWSVNQHFWRYLSQFMIDENTGILNFRDDYEISSIEISLLTTQWKPFYKYNFKSCFLTGTIPEIQLDAAIGGGNVNFSVTLNYENYTTKFLDVVQENMDSELEFVNALAKKYYLGDQFTDNAANNNPWREHKIADYLKRAIQSKSKKRGIGEQFLDAGINAVGGALNNTINDVESRIGGGLSTLITGAIAGDAAELAIVAAFLAENAVKNLAALTANNGLGIPSSAIALNTLKTAYGKVLGPAEQKKAESSPGTIPTSFSSNAQTGPAISSNDEQAVNSSQASTLPPNAYTHPIGPAENILARIFGEGPKGVANAESSEKKVLWTANSDGSPAISKATSDETKIMTKRIGRIEISVP